MSDGAELDSRRAWTRLAACTGAAALLQHDGTLITVALPAFAHRLGGLGLFAIGAAAGAVSTGIGGLVATRVVQGAGAGLVSAAALAGAVSGFPPERLGRALGVWGASAGVANLLGPLIGGLLTVAFGWRADWWALVPLSLLAIWAVITHLPALTPEPCNGPRAAAFTRVVLAAAFIAALTFAVMIGAFYLAEQYLTRTAGFSTLGASSVLVVVVLLVGAAAPIAGRVADRRGEQLPVTAGFLAAALGLLVLGLPGVSLRKPDHAGAADSDRTWARNVVRAGVARRAERDTPCPTRLGLGGSLGWTAARCCHRSRSGRIGAVRRRIHVDRAPRLAARLCRVSARRTSRRATSSRTRSPISGCWRSRDRGESLR